MRTVPVYKAELEAGLGDLIRSTASARFSAQAEILTPSSSPSERVLARARDLGVLRTKSSVDDFDLFYLKTVLTTAGVWNRNDDYFDPLDCWLARSTPVDKQFNYEHDCSDIIGHMVGCYGVDDSGATIDEAVAADDLPAKLHLVAEAVLYRYWADAELQERMDRVIAEIGEGKWFVSMEALFRDFDYVVQDTTGVCKVVARTKDTAFLTKHLRAYGGSGSYRDQKVGRVLRDFVFSGKGLVSNPANPESVILTTASLGNSAAEKNGEFPEPGYSTATEQGSQTQESEHEMPENTDLQKKVDELTKANAELEAKLTEKAQAEVNALQSKLDAVTKELETAKAALAAEAKVAADAKAELEKANEAKAAAETELAEIRKKERTAARVKLVLDAWKADASDAEVVSAAESYVVTLDGMGDADFGKLVTLQTKFSSAPFPPKSTPAQSPPTVTDKPAPMRGEASEVEEENADPANLETAEPEKAAAASVDAPDARVAKVGSDIAKYFSTNKS